MLGLLAHFDKLFDFLYPEGLEGKPREKSSTPKNEDWGQGGHEKPCSFLWLNSCLPDIPLPLIKRKIDNFNYKIVVDGNLNACWKVST